MTAQDPMPVFRSRLRAEISDGPSASIVRLTGEFDPDDAAALRHLLLERVDAGHSLIVELSHLEFIDSSGLAALVAAHKAAQAAGSAVVLAAPSAATVKVLAISGLSRVLTSAPSVEAALKLLPVG